MTRPVSTTQRLYIRLCLAGAVLIALVLDLNSAYCVIACLMYSAILVTCLCLRDRPALLCAGFSSITLLLLTTWYHSTTHDLLFSLQGQLGTTLGTLLLITLPGAQVLKRWEQQQQQLLAQAQTDSLTGLVNRRWLDNHLSRCWHQAKRHQQQLSILMLDLDYFKRLNDDLGHLEGDKVLIRFAALLEQLCRECDIAGRFGGEEFMVICPNTDNQGALALAERIRTRWISYNQDLPFPITVSIGIAQYHPKLVDLSELIAKADAALYFAKAQGRNNTQISHITPSFDCVQPYRHGAQASASHTPQLASQQPSQLQQYRDARSYQQSMQVSSPSANLRSM